MKVGLLKGDGIGPEISDAVVKIFEKLKAPIEWENIPCGEATLASENSAMPASSIAAVKKLKVALKGPTGTPIGKGHQSANVALRKHLDLYANVRPIQQLPGVERRFTGIDLIIIRENTEDVYTAIEHQVSEDVVQCLKIITRPACERIVRYAFQIAKTQGRKKVTCIHKANIMKMTDGLFLKVFQQIAAEYPEIESGDMIVDNACMQLVTNPQRYDVLVMGNLYGDIISDLCAALVGGLGLAGGSNIGEAGAVFEAVHGTAPDIAGKNLANPTAILLSSLMMLEHLQLFDHAKKLRAALYKTLGEDGIKTRDLKGTAGTDEYTNAIIRNL